MSYKTNWETEPCKLNNVELIKLKKDGLDVINTIVEKYAIEGFQAVSEDDRVLLKWAGIYDQKPKDGHFMMRVRINSGIMNTKQALAIADIAHKYGRDRIKITSRGAIQFYWITLEQLPDIFKTFQEVGLSTFEACGDCPRTIVGNPLTGIDQNELFDTTELVADLNEFFLLNKDFSNLPRKLKISISSSIFNPAHKEINDISFTPATKMINGTEVIGFHVFVGGGLSTKPYMAKQLDIFVQPDQVLKVAEGVATIFRDHGYREKRQHARLKFLVEDWGADKFKDMLIQFTGPMPTHGIDRTQEWKGAFFYGIHPQKQEGKSYLGLHVPMGHMEADSLYQLIDIAKQYGDDKLRTTMSQNIILSGIDNSDIEDVLQQPILKKLPVQESSFLTNMIACTGSEFCNIALVETKDRAKDIAQFLDDHIEFLPVRINIVGCPNSCGHALIADIGLRGSLAKTDAGVVEAFDIFIGGVLGSQAQFGSKLQGRVKANNINDALLDIISFYKMNRLEEETFSLFSQRIELASFQDIVNKYI